MTTPADRARYWAPIYLGAGIGLIVGSLIVALLAIARDNGVVTLDVHTGTTEVGR